MSTKGRPSKKSKWKVVFKLIHQKDGSVKEVFDRYDGSWDHEDVKPELKRRYDTKWHEATYRDPTPEEYATRGQYNPPIIHYAGPSGSYGKVIDTPGYSEKLETYYERWAPGVKYVDPFEWEDEFTYTDYGRGRSAAYFTWETKYGPMQMFMTDMDFLLKNANIVDGKVKGYWGFRKFGANVGVCYLGKEKPCENDQT